MGTLRFWLSIALLLALLPAAGAAQDEPLRRARLVADDAPGLAAELADQGYDLLYDTITQDSFELILSAAGFERLVAEGRALELLDVGRPFAEIQAEQLGRDPESIPAGYGNVEQILAQMTAAAASYPAICRVVDLTETYGMPTTHEGRHLYAVKISDNVAQEEDEPAMLVVSCHHAREIVTPVIALVAMGKLTSQYGTDPTITALVDEHEIWIAPLWNPDGYHHVYYVDNYWRKNRRPVTGGIGIDQNRNYPFGWYNPCSGSSTPSSETYKGPSPASEAETQTMLAWSLDQRFLKVIDYHSSGREVVYGYDCWSHPYDNFIHNEAAALSSASGYSGYCRGPSGDGEHYQWQQAMMACHAFLIETATSFQPSYAGALQEAEIVWPGIRWMLQRPIPIWGHVTDAASGLPLEAEVTLVGVTYPNGEENWSAGPHGRYQIYVPAGTYSVRFEADGCPAYTATGVTVTASGSTRLDVELVNPMAAPAAQSGPRLALSAPTPFRAPGTLRFDLPSAGRAALRLYDVRGGVVRTLLDGPAAAGPHQAIWDGADGEGRPLPAGAYFYRLSSPDGEIASRLLLLR